MKNLIYFENEQSLFEISENIIQIIEKCCEATLKQQKIETPCEISVLFCDNLGIREINRENRNKDTVTDVLSFPMSENIFEPEINEENGYIILGDIIISLEKAMEQAKEYGHSFEREIGFLCVHSILHLLGYDHEKSKEQEEFMIRTQESILSSLNLTRD